MKKLSQLLNLPKKQKYTCLFRRYKVRIEVEDNTGKAFLTLFEKEATEIMQMSCDVAILLRQRYYGYQTVLTSTKQLQTSRNQLINHTNSELGLIRRTTTT